MKQNTEQLKKELNKLIWEKSYAEFKKGNIGEDYEEYPDYITDVLMDFFLPHLISSDEIKREEQRRLVGEIYRANWIKILSNATKNRPTSWGDDAVREWRNASDEVLMALMSELKATGAIADELKEFILTQSKEGGE